METIKIVRIPVIEDFQNKYAILFDEKNKFVGIILNDQDSDTFDVIDAEGKCSYNDIIDLFDTYIGNTIKLISPGEMANIMETLKIDKTHG